MATLHGILAELGIENPAMHPEREVSRDRKSKWIVDEIFLPVEGESYELAFGKLFFDGEHRHVIKRVRIAGSQAGDWFDLDEGKPLDKNLQTAAVKAFRRIG